MSAVKEKARVRSQGITDARESGGVCRPNLKAEPTGEAGEVTAESAFSGRPAFMELGSHCGWSFGMRVGPGREGQAEDLGF